MQQSEHAAKRLRLHVFEPVVVAFGRPFVDQRCFWGESLVKLFVHDPVGAPGKHPAERNETLFLLRLFLLFLVFLRFLRGRLCFFRVELQIEFDDKRIAVRPNVAFVRPRKCRREVDPFYWNLAAIFQVVAILVAGKAT
jgi:hypothetical protein